MAALSSTAFSINFSPSTSPEVLCRHNRLEIPFLQVFGDVANPTGLNLILTMSSMVSFAKKDAPVHHSDAFVLTPLHTPVVIDLFAHFEQLPDVGELSRIIFSVGIAHELCHFILGLSLDFSSPLSVAVRRFALISARVLQQETHYTFKKV